MTKNYKMTIAYDGSRYYGWAQQKSIDQTVQGKIEAVLSEMCATKVMINGSGRTDAGVHAKGMVANGQFYTDLSPAEIQAYLNRYLPDDICIMDLKVASDQFHARFNAVGKTYRYACYVGSLKPVFDRKYVYTLEKMPDISRMKQAAALLIGQHDFKSFCGNPKMKKSTVRMVDSIEITKEGDYLYFTYHGEGFLQYMIRILTGTLLEVGYGKKKPEDIPRILEARDRSQAGFTAPAQGLTLIQVDYNKG